MSSPYEGIPSERWLDITKQLINQHPLPPEEIVDIVLTAWNAIFASTMGSKGFRIGVDISPKPQIMGFFLHELIPLELSTRYPDKWRVEKSGSDKDIVHIPDDQYSIELKTSSHPTRIFGNRSYAQETISKGKKAKSGYYLAINFEKFVESKRQPRIRLIRFGWIDSYDWIGQKAATGQQSRLLLVAENYKLIRLFPIS